MRITKARLVVIKGKKVLLLKKINKKKRLSFPGGIIKRHETVKEGLVREAKEELGVDLKKSDLTKVLTLYKYKKDVKIITHYYRLNKKIDTFKLNEPDKFDVLSWFHFKDAKPSIKDEEQLVLVEKVNKNKAS